MVASLCCAAVTVVAASLRASTPSGSRALEEGGSKSANRRGYLCRLLEALFVFSGFSGAASAATFSVTYPDSPSLSVVAGLGGAPTTGDNSIANVMSITGSGPMYFPDTGSGWEETASVTILPEGMPVTGVHATSAPSALPLFISALGAMGSAQDAQEDMQPYSAAAPQVG